MMASTECVSRKNAWQPVESCCQWMSSRMRRSRRHVAPLMSLTYSYTGSPLRRDLERQLRALRRPQARDPQHVTPAVVLRPGRRRVAAGDERALAAVVFGELAVLLRILGDHLVDALQPVLEDQAVARVADLLV